VTELTFQPPKEGLMSGVMRLSQGGKPVLLLDADGKPGKIEVVYHRTMH
jgi:hypothetical protein